MFGDIARFLLNTVFMLFGAALLLRAWLQFVRLPPYNPVTNAVLHVTNWIVLPLRHIVPATRKLDWASLIAVLIAGIVYVVLMIVVSGADPLQMWPTLLIVLGVLLMMYTE